jgi:hypothetical protein
VAVFGLNGVELFDCGNAPTLQLSRKDSKVR